MSIPAINEYIRQKTKIVRAAEVAREVKEIVFERPVQTMYLPGQFVGIQIPDQKGEPGFRSYSMMDSADGNIALFVKKVEGGRGSAYLHTLQKGDEIEIIFPLGYFGFQKNLSDELVFVATGTGIVPIISLLDHLPSDFSGKATLYFGVRSEEDIFCEEQLEKIKERYPGFSYTITLSRPTKQWSGSIGRVTEKIKSASLSPKAQCYICGGGEMIAEVKSLLRLKRVPEANIHYEDFNS